MTKEKIRNGHDVVKKNIMLIFLILSIIFLCFACDSGNISGSSKNNSSIDTSSKQLYSISDVKTDDLEKVLGKSVEDFVNQNEDCKLVVVEDTGDSYNIVPIRIQGDARKQGVYFTQLGKRKDQNPYGPYSTCGTLSSTGNMQNMRVPNLECQRELNQRINECPYRETCAGYQNYMNNQNANYTSTTTIITNNAISDGSNN